MYNINPTLIRSSFIWKIVKWILEDKWITITEISDKIKSSRPSVSNALNWKIAWSDSMYEKIMTWIGLSKKEINEIFKMADEEEFKYKHWENINLLDDINFDVALRKEFWKEIDNETISKIKEFINFVTKK